MTLKEFIEKLKNIKRKHGGDVEVIMSDGIPIVSPIFKENRPEGGRVIVTNLTESKLGID